jgi:hypothetical protein
MIIRVILIKGWSTFKISISGIHTQTYATGPKHNEYDPYYDTSQAGFISEQGNTQFSNKSQLNNYFSQYLTQKPQAPRQTVFIYNFSYNIICIHHHFLMYQISHRNMFLFITFLWTIVIGSIYIIEMKLVIKY